MNRPYRDAEEKQVRVVLSRMTDAALELTGGYPEEAQLIWNEALQALLVLNEMIEEFDNE
jgi:hypothetical protein